MTPPIPDHLYNVPEGTLITLTQHGWMILERMNDNPQTPDEYAEAITYCINMAEQHELVSDRELAIADEWSDRAAKLYSELQELLENQNKLRVVQLDLNPDFFCEGPNDS